VRLIYQKLKKKHKLNQLEVQSFITSVNNDAARQMKGAGSQALCNSHVYCLTILPGCDMPGISQGANVCSQDSC